MSENIEIKASCQDLNSAEQRIKAITDHTPQRDYQVDTYFNVAHGRFKLRESTIDGNYLVPYVRADKSEPRKSLYAKISIEDPVLVKQLFSLLMGTHVIVSKERTIYRYENVRIHLDRVEHLGTFIELEAVMDESNNDIEAETQKVQKLMQLIGIGKADLLSLSYESMLRARNTKK